MEPRVELKAKELAEVLARSEAFTRLEKAKDEISKRTAAQIMLRDLEERQKRLLAKRREGQEPTEAEIQDLQRMSQIASMNPYIRQLFEAQNELIGMMMEVQSLLMRAVNLEQESDAETAAESSDTETDITGDAGENLNKETIIKSESSGQKPRSRLWVPGGYRD
jgi:cell fate (sporulation/competence/biofilm development) regulator YlbF (YheA/YmcA/DUF963 family)